MRQRKPKKYQNTGSTVVVEDGKFEKALRLFKNKIEASGILKEVRERQHYTKPTTKRKMKANAARRRWAKKLESEQLPPRQF